MTALAAMEDETTGWRAARRRERGEVMGRVGGLKSLVGRFKTQVVNPRRPRSGRQAGRQATGMPRQASASERKKEQEREREHDDYNHAAWPQEGHQGPDLDPLGKDQDPWAMD